MDRPQVTPWTGPDAVGREPWSKLGVTGKANAVAEGLRRGLIE